MCSPELWECPPLLKCEIILGGILRQFLRDLSGIIDAMRSLSVSVLGAAVRPSNGARPYRRNRAIPLRFGRLWVLPSAIPVAPYSWFVKDSLRMAAQFLASRGVALACLLVCPRIPPISLCVLYDQNWRYVAPGRCLCRLARRVASFFSRLLLPHGATTVPYPHATLS